MMASAKNGGRDSGLVEEEDEEDVAAGNVEDKMLRNMDWLEGSAVNMS